MPPVFGLIPRPPVLAWPHLGCGELLPRNPPPDPWFRKDLHDILLFEAMQPAVPSGSPRCDSLCGDSSAPTSEPARVAAEGGRHEKVFIWSFV